MDKVLISYSRRNLETVERLARDLQDAGLDVWVDFRKIKGGTSWQEAIYQGIIDSDYVIVCMSPPAAESEWVRRELEMARKHDKLIIPVMLERAFDEMEKYPITKGLLDVQIINFADLNYERAFPTLLSSLPGVGREANYDDIDPSEIPNPFKGLQSFQETDADIFFGRENLVEKAILRLSHTLTSQESARFMAFVGASGSGKSSVVRAGVIPKIRQGALPESEDFPIAIFKPGDHPVQALARRLVSLVSGKGYDDIVKFLQDGATSLSTLAETIMDDEDHYLVLVIDQFEEVFTRVGPEEQREFFDLLHHAVTDPASRVIVMPTMRADFFDNLSYFPKLASLFDSNNLIIVAEMSPEELRRSIEGPAIAVGLVYAHGLPDRLLDEVLSQPGSLPLLQYALSELYDLRDRRQLTWESYEQIGGVRQALAQHAENVFTRANSAEQDIMQRLLLRLVEVNENGEATRRRVERRDLSFERVSENALNDLLAKLTSADVRLLVTSREISSDNAEENAEPTVYVEIVHEALIREWERFRKWVREDEENLRLSTEILKSAQDWENTGNEPAYLLTETRLDRALVWLQTADATDLQRNFINASQKARREREASEREQQAYVYELEERNRQRLQVIIGVLIVGVFVAIGFGVYGFAQARIATQARTAAEASERNTRSRALANEVQEAVAIPNAPLALALAAEANSFDNAPPIAQSALAEIAYLGPRNVYETENILFPDTDDIDLTVLHTLFLGEPNRLLAVGYVDERLIVFDVDTGDILREVAWVALEDTTSDTDEAISTIATAALSPDGAYLVAGGTLGQVIIWRMDNGELISQSQRSESEGRVRAIAFSPNSDQFATANDNTVVNLWALSTGDYIHSYGTNDSVGTDDDPVGHESAVLAIAFSNDGTQLVSGGADNKVILWDVDNRNIIWESGENDAFSWVRSVAFDATDALIAAGTSRGNLLVWRVNSEGADRVVIDEAHQGAILAINFAPIDVFGNSETLVTASTDGNITLWNAENMNINRRHSYSDYVGAVTSVIYRPDRQTLLSVGDGDRLIEWDTEQGAINNRYNTDVHTDVVWDVALAPDNETALTGSSDGNIIVWDLVNSRPILPFIPTDYTDNTAVEYSPDGSLALVGTGKGDLLVYDTDTWEQIAQVDGHIDTVRDLVFSPDGRTAMSISDDGTLIIWDMEQVTKVRQVTFFDDIIWEIIGIENATYELEGFDDDNLGSLFLPTLWSIAYAPDGEHVLIGEDDGNVIWWNPFVDGQDSVLFLENDNGETPHNDTVRSVAISPDNTFALTASDDGVFLQWNLSDNDNPRLDATTYENAGRINDITISSDGRFALTASENQAGTEYTVDMWDIASGERIRSLDGHTDWVSAVRYSTDGRFALSASADNTLIEWRIDTDRELFEWTLENRAVLDMTCTQRADWSAENCDEDGNPPYAFDELLADFATDEPMRVPDVEIINGTATPTLVPTDAPTNTPIPTPTSTPQPLTASIGRTDGSLAVGSADAWLLEVTENIVLTFRVMADVPVFAPHDDPNEEAIISEDGLDTRLQILDSAGAVIAEHDDIQFLVNTNSEIVNLSLTPDTYQIIVSSFNNSTAGDYTLEIIEAPISDTADD